MPDLGPRGEGWVVLQVVVGAVIAGCGFVGVYWPGRVEGVFVVLGLLVAVVGLLLALLGFVALGRSLTPLPRPHARSELRQGGVFKLARHPIYGGVLLLALAWSLADAPLALVPTALLLVVFELKARREEEWLIERYPEYEAYRRRTPHRFVPWLY